MKKILLCSTPLLFSLLACSSPERVYENDESFVVVDFRDSLDSSTVDVIGVTIRPDTGQRYVLDSARGIFEVDLDGNMSIVRALQDFPLPDEVIQSDFTDIASLGGQRFALTARNEGYLLDLDANTLRRHFCYLPEGEDVQEVYQLTQSVTYDAETQKIYAQPQTLALDTGSVQASSIGMFGVADGAEQTWFALGDPSFIAGAIAMDAEGQLILAEGDTISRFNFMTQVHDSGVSLDAYEVGRVTGLAVDLEAQTMLIVDGARDALLELPLSLLD
jgi:hypothetical protein